ncbi:hypothetical protein BJ912DRAFT_995442 [Pholiota molesta]|nr:hypothetical protein BJ912DRAFT_995442 [Pholiota molesta]
MCTRRDMCWWVSWSRARSMTLSLRSALISLVRAGASSTSRTTHQRAAWSGWRHPHQPVLSRRASTTLRSCSTWVCAASVPANARVLEQLRQA